MPSTSEAIDHFHENKVVFAAAKVRAWPLALCPSSQSSWVPLLQCTAAPPLLLRSCMVMAACILEPDTDACRLPTLEAWL